MDDDPEVHKELLTVFFYQLFLFCRMKQHNFYSNYIVLGNKKISRRRDGAP